MPLTAASRTAASIRAKRRRGPSSSACGRCRRRTTVATGDGGQLRMVGECGAAVPPAVGLRHLQLGAMQATGVRPGRLLGVGEATFRLIRPSSPGGVPEGCRHCRGAAPRPRTAGRESAARHADEAGPASPVWPADVVRPVVVNETPEPDHDAPAQVRQQPPYVGAFPESHPARLQDVVRGAGRRLLTSAAPLGHRP